jgi:hypothetical protein
MSQDAWVLIVLFLFMMVVCIVFARQQESRGGYEMLPNPTTYSPNASGLEGLYDTLKSLGYPVTRQLSPLTDLPRDGVLFVVAPTNSISSQEWDAIRTWVERGNLLIAVPSASLQITDKAPRWIKSVPTVPSFAAEGVGAFLVPEESYISDDRGQYGYGRSFEEPTKSLTRTKSTLEPTVSTTYPLLPIFKSNMGTTVSFSRTGKGGVLVLCDSWTIANQGIGSDDNLIVILNALNHRDPQHRLAITFDEYHHGYNEGEGITSLLGAPARLGLAQLAMAFILLLFAVSRRFGQVLPLVEGERHRGEYLGSMSSLLRKAHATRMVHSELGHRFIHDIALILGLPPTATPDEIIAAATQRRPDKADALRRLIEAATGPLFNAYDESAMLALAKQWHRMRKELMKPK